MARKTKAPKSNSPKIKRTRHQTLGFLGEQILNGLACSDVEREIRDVIAKESFQDYNAPLAEEVERAGMSAPSSGTNLFPYLPIGESLLTAYIEPRFEQANKRSADVDVP